MSKIKDIVIGLVMSMLMLIVWAYKMLVTSDIPVGISFNDSILISCLLILFFILYSFYTRKTKHILINTTLLLIPLFVWFMSVQQALTYHYHKYDTIVSVIGFFCVLILFFQTIYLKVKRKLKL